MDTFKNKAIAGRILAPMLGLIVGPVFAEPILYTLTDNGYNTHYYGESVSTAGDVNGDGFDDVIIGASYNGSSLYNTYDNYGRAYVLSGANGQVMYSFNGSSGSYFGSSVSGGGDVNNDGYHDLIIGAWSEDGNGKTDSGSARVYSGFNGALLYTFYGDSAGDYFGTSVGNAGDVNNDGYDDVIVGANGDDNNNKTSSGSARVFSGFNGAILFTFDGYAQNDSLGSAVGKAGDINGDGYGDVIIGAAGSYGQARIHSGLNGTELYKFAGYTSGSQFGRSVSTAGDINGDGYPDVVVGEPGADDNGTNSGAARVLSGATGNVLYTFYGAQAADNFGFSVSGGEDINNDGTPDLVIGADYGNSVRVINGANGSTLYTFQGDDLDDRLGVAVSVAGDVNGDGYGDVVAGSPYALKNDGFARIYSGKGQLLDSDNDGQNEYVDSDDDNDGMPDKWESIVGLDPRLANAAADPDNDGFTNLQEYNADTPPLVASRELRNDFNGDGRSDLLFINLTTGSTHYWPGGIKAQAVYPGAMDLSYSYKGAGDFDGNGTADLFFTKATNNGTLIWNGAMKTAAAYPGTSTAGFSVAAICDTTGDGKDDVIWYNSSTGGLHIWPGALKSSVTFPGAQSAAYSLVACNDFNGDSKADLYWRNQTTGASEIWLGAVKATKTYPGKLADPEWSPLASGDTNGNGTSDLFWYRANGYQTQLWEGGLKSATSYPGGGGGSQPVTMADYNGDGKADLLLINGPWVEVWYSSQKSYGGFGQYISGFTAQK